MKTITLTFVFSLIYSLGFTQTFSGRLADERTGEVLPGANLYWMDTTVGTSTDEGGNFELPKTNENEWLVISYIGYSNDTLYIGSETGPVLIELELSGGEDLQEVVVQGDRAGTFITNDVAKVEAITEAELTKAACCDLAGCFSTQTTVQPVTTNVITNAKELRILGLSGVYNQLLFDGMPMVQGLGYTYGVSSYPGTLINTIFVAKGSNSVLQGFEGMSGQINVIPKSPDDTDKLLLNTYLNSHGIHQFNANYATTSKKGWSNLAAAHISRPGFRMDVNEDTFLDRPLIERQVIYNKWMSNQDIEKGWLSQIGVRFWNEQRIGGQTDFKASDKGSDSVYGQLINIQQPELYTKTAYRLNAKQQITFIGSTFYHHQDSWFGITKYDANQFNAYANAQFEWQYRDKHNMKTGISYRHSDVSEVVEDENFRQQNYIPGVFAENTLTFDKLDVITGVRLDIHQEHGTFLTPRALVRYQLTDNTNIRASFGTGWRTALVFAEHPNLLVSSREVIFTETLEPEQTINFGTNITHKQFWDNLVMTITADVYHTRFSNQIFPDYDSEPNQAILYNFRGVSASNAAQVDISWKLQDKYEWKLGYNYLDVYRVTNEIKTEQPFNSKHRIVATFSYQPLNKKWHFDTNAYWRGKQRMPNTDAYPTLYQRSAYSPTYVLFNAQFTRSWKKLDIYMGCENILGVRQNDPIMAWQEPFSPYFDTAFSWGPTTRREFYIGARYRIE